MELRANGAKLTLIAGVDGIKKGVPFLHGELFVIPASDAKAGKPYTGIVSGAFTEFDALLADGVTVTDKDTAYFTPEGKLTKAKTGNIKVGHFVENFEELMLLVK
ncbi:DUF2190 family protein [Vibrio aestuarianus]|uniref:DUF2190 family protein n=1 Tax=Vibrio aestuarianus TaxID=28171 RepID=UPI001593BBCB|nr:DUF2190 family protein [Vibrio aestuarianus]NGZ18033.1 DUF2190 family protein [Vibrio aestuarianus]